MPKVTYCPKTLCPIWQFAKEDNLPKYFMPKVKICPNVWLFNYQKIVMGLNLKICQNRLISGQICTHFVSLGIGDISLMIIWLFGHVVILGIISFGHFVILGQNVILTLSILSYLGILSPWAFYHTIKSYDSIYQTLWLWILFKIDFFCQIILDSLRIHVLQCF